MTIMATNNRFAVERTNVLKSDVTLGVSYAAIDAGDFGWYGIAGQTYAFDARIVYSAAAATDGAAFSINAPATPPQGASIASRGTGRFFSAFVHPDEQVQTFHDRLIHDNPNAFYGTFRKRIPTSIDLLEPSDNSLQSIYDLPVPYNVREHLIIGTGEGPWTLGLNDGVVPVSSARHRCADTEMQVKASHTKILKHEETISEVIRLLHLHLTEVESQN